MGLSHMCSALTSPPGWCDAPCSVRPTDSVHGACQPSDSPGQGLATRSLRANSRQLPVCGNKAPLEHSTDVPSHTVCGGFHATRAELSWDWRCMANEAKTINGLALSRKSLPSPGLEFGCIRVQCMRMWVSYSNNVRCHTGPAVNYMRYHEHFTPTPSRDSPEGHPHSGWLRLWLTFCPAHSCFPRSLQQVLLPRTRPSGHPACPCLLGACPWANSIHGHPRLGDVWNCLMQGTVVSRIMSSQRYPHPDA